MGLGGSLLPRRRRTPPMLDLARGFLLLAHTNLDHYEEEGLQPQHHLTHFLPREVLSVLYFELQRDLGLALATPTEGRVIPVPAYGTFCLEKEEAASTLKRTSRKILTITMENLAAWLDSFLDSCMKSPSTSLLTGTMTTKMRLVPPPIPLDQYGIRSI